MNEAFAKKLQKTHVLVWLFLGMLLFKLSVEAGYLQTSLRFHRTDYPLSFNPVKYAVGLLWCVLFFVNIRHTERKASTFFLYFTFLFQVVPIISVYALKDENSVYFHVLCLSFLLCELIVGYTGDPAIFRRSFPVSRIMTLSFAAAAGLVIIYIVLKNGAPNLSLLDIYSVYEYRSSGAFQASKYMYYLIRWTAKVFLPFGIARALTDRKYPAAALAGGLLLLIYLYTGMKGFLFLIPTVAAATLWAGRKNCYQELFLTGCAGFSILTLLSCVTRAGSLSYKLFSLLGRRTILLPARLKFDYFDYFSSHPKLGLSGLFPRWLINIPAPSYYKNISYTNEIGVIYSNGGQNTSANTGFFAEGFMRFGHIGTVLIFILFALILRQIDRFQERAGYQLTVGLFIGFFYEIIDAALLDGLIIGPWMFLEAILLFYTYKPPKQQPKQQPKPLKEAVCEHPGTLPGPV